MSKEKSLLPFKRKGGFNFKVSVKEGMRYIIRGYRHFILECYKCDNPIVMMCRNDRLGVMETGDRIKVIRISENYTEIKVSGQTVWVHTHSLSCSIKKL